LEVVICRVMGTSLAEIPQEARQAEAGGQAPRGGLMSRKNLRTNAGLWLSLFATSYFSYGYIYWTTILLVKHGLSMTVGIGAVFTYTVCTIVGGITAPVSLSWIGSRMTMIFAACITFLATLLLGVYLRLDGENYMAINVVIAVAGVATGVLFSLLYTLAATAYPYHYRGTGIGVSATIARLGGIVTILIGGLLLSLDSSGMVHIALLCAVISLVVPAALLFDHHWPRAKDRAEPDMLQDCQP